MQTIAGNPQVVLAEGLHKDFYLGDEVIQALCGVELRVARGAFVAIMGPSGSGKTTLLHLLGGLDLPTSGIVQIDGKHLARLDDKARTLFRRRRLGIIFQSFNLMPTLTALENVMLPLLIDGRPAAEARRRAEELLKLVNLQHRHKHRPALMSGGEQQRVAIARALMNEPVLILADEPTGNLDPTSSLAVWNLLRRLAAEMHTTVVMVTHEADAASHADVVHFIREGRFAGTAEPKGTGDAALVAARYEALAN